MTTDPQTDPREPDNPAAYALARHIADHPVSTVQAAFRYLNAPLTIELHEDPTAPSVPSAVDRAELREQIVRQARTVPLRLGPNAIAMAQRGEPIILNLNEADDLADAVLARCWRSFRGRADDETEGAA